MNRTGWWAELNDDEASNMHELWQPTLSLNGLAVSLDMGFTAKADCEEFIRKDVLGQGMLRESQ